MENVYECLNCRERSCREPFTVCDNCLLHKGINPRGASLRDEIAMRAMAAILSADSLEPQINDDKAASVLATSAYKIADAMLRARVQS